VVAVLSQLPADFPACIAVVQHLPVGFAKPFADYLRNHCRMPVSLVEGEAEVRKGHVLVASDDRHLVAKSASTLITENAPPVNGFRPSVNAMFSSLAKVFGSSAMGVILTGMGSDGAVGLRALRQAGGYTYGQDETSCAVYGMPRAAREAGAVVRELPLDMLAADLEERVRRALLEARGTRPS
jgi:two-component system chemotaxis response regulator CheB